MKRTPLKRKTGIKHGGNLKRTGFLRPRSEKTQRLYEEQRIPLVKRILEERPICETCETFARKDGVVKKANPSQDCHEKLTRGRSGGVQGTAWLDETNILAVCRPCHRRITDNPEEAEQLGFLTPTHNNDTIVENETSQHEDRKND